MKTYILHSKHEGKFIRASLEDLIPGSVTDDIASAELVVITYPEDLPLVTLWSRSGKKFVVCMVPELMNPSYPVPKSLKCDLPVVTTEEQLVAFAKAS